jgi:uncharacterized protein with PIN domain
MESFRFLTDENLLGLARKLRLLGYDTAVMRGATEEELMAHAEDHDRILLTKNRHLLKQMFPGDGVFIAAIPLDEQIEEVLTLYPPTEKEVPLSRCLECNTLIEHVDKVQVKGLVEEKTYNLYDTFYSCPTCHRVYWEGSHFEKLQDKISSLHNHNLKR